MGERTVFPVSGLPLSDRDMVERDFVNWVSQSGVHRKMLPHICSLSELYGQALPDEVVGELKQSRMETVAYTLRLKSETDKLTASLSSLGVPVIVMKGSDLAQRLYNGLHQRPFGDIDLLVKAADIDRAVNMLLDTGYHDVSTNPDQFHLEFERLSKQGFVFRVELHRRLLGYAIGGDHLVFALAGSKGLSESVWERARQFGGQWRMQPTDELLYLCLHLAKHLVVESRIYATRANCSSLLLARDINLALDKWYEDIDWLAFFSRVSQFHLDQPVHMALVFTRSWFVDGCEELDEYTRSFPAWRRRRYLDWVRDPWLPVPKAVPGRHELQMIVEGFMMSSRWSDRLLILPLAIGEFFRRRFNR